MEYEITPEPDEDERRAILEALAAEDAERPPESPWPQAARPGHGGEEP
jgi:hypothetical protein